MVAGRVVLAEARKNFILKRLDQEGSVSIADLARTLNASRETIRRDLKQLASKDLLRQTHGGAVVMAPMIFERGTVTAEVHCGADGAITDVKLQPTQSMDSP